MGGGVTQGAKHWAAKTLSKQAIKVGHDVITAWRIFRGDQAGPAVPRRCHGVLFLGAQRKPSTAFVLAVDVTMGAAASGDNTGCDGD